MTPIQGKHLMSSGSTGYFSNSDKISGRTFDGNNEHFFLCHFFLFFNTLFTPTSSCDYFLNKCKFGILHVRIFWQRKVPEGLSFPQPGPELGRTGDSAQEGLATGAEPGQEPAQPWPESPAATRGSLPAWAATQQFHSQGNLPLELPWLLAPLTACGHALILEWELAMPLD